MAGRAGGLFVSSSSSSSSTNSLLGRLSSNLAILPSISGSEGYRRSFNVLACSSSQQQQQQQLLPSLRANTAMMTKNTLLTTMALDRSFKRFLANENKEAETEGEVENQQEMVSSGMPVKGWNLKPFEDYITSKDDDVVIGRPWSASELRAKVT